MTPLGPQAAEGIGPKALNAAVLRIRDVRGEPVGLGFLVSPELALTCAHVVSAALGTPQDQEPQASARIHVDLPLLSASGAGGTGVTASVEHWMPPQESGGGDVAVLRLDAPLPGAHPVRLIEAEEVWEHPVRAFGFPAGRPGGVWHSGVLRAKQAHGWVQADLAGQGYPVSRGFSGTPAWDEHLVGVVGMVAVAESGQPPVSYLIPTVGLLQAWPELRGLALPPSPFRSLSAYQEADAPLFHGRRAESDELARALSAEQWVTVVGASGSGKSSLALAGVVPRLRASGAEAVVVRPASGSSPLAALAAGLLPLLEPGLPKTSETQRLAWVADLTEALGRGGLADVVTRVLELRKSRRLLVVVDQFEELLALAPEAVNELADVLFDDALPHTVRVLTTLRADFLELALAHPRLGPVLSQRVHALGPLGPERLREVVTAPVDAIPGVRYEPALVDHILEDTGTEPGALPLLGFTLDLLWQGQSGGLLTYQAYRTLGGVTGALSAHADQVWAEYVPAQDEPAARRLFTQLIRIPMGSAAATRRMALRSELGEHEWRIAQQLAATRLLVTGRSAEGSETVELVHEALINGWEKLARWAAEDRSFLQWRESLRHDMDRWEGSERKVPPHTVALEGARLWVSERGADLSTAEHAFLEAARAYSRSRTRRRRAALSFVAVLTVVAMMSTTFLVAVRQESRVREALATSRALTQASQDVASTDPARSVMLALAAYETSPTQEARNQLLRVYLMHSGKGRVLSGLLGTVRRLETSLDGNVVLATSTNGRATLFVHAVTGEVRSAQVPSVGQVQYPMVSADGRRAGYVQEDGKAAWFSVNADGEHLVGELHRLPEAPGTATGSNKKVIPSMSVDGTLIVSRVLDRLVWWDLESGTVVRSTPAPGDYDDDSVHLWIAADNQTVLLQRDGLEKNTSALLAHDAATGATRVVVTDVDEIELSGDRTAAVACRAQSNGPALSLLRISDGAQQGEPYGEQEERYKTDRCWSHSVNTTGSQVAVSSADTIRVVDLLQRKVVSTVPTAKSTYGSRRLVSAGGKLFYVTWQDSLITYTELPPGGGVLSVGQQRLTNDGTRTISVLADGSSMQLRPSADQDSDRLLAEASRRKPYWKPGNDDLLKLSRDGSLLADQEGQNVVSVREVSTLREVAIITAAEPPPLPVPKPSILGPALPPGEAWKWGFQYFFDPDGKVLTISGSVVQRWEPRTGREIVRFDVKALLPEGTPEGGPEIDVAPYPAPNKVSVIRPGDPEVRIVDITTGAITETVRTTEDVLAVQFDPSGRYFGLMRRGAIVELWRRDPLRRELGPLQSTTEDLVTPTVTRFLDGDGRFLIAANNAVRIYRVGERAPEDSYEFGKPPGTSDGSYRFLDISGDGKMVIYADRSGPGGPLALDPQVWQYDLCRIIGYRKFTDDERASLPARVPAHPRCTEH
ncbi:serine protease [Streptomyces sp. NBC_01443]|uniref:nSTAND1 domain-containing NTPase n=1 Tax=Streptomyces sp. NBC_01443 TaxID=2903868 RepID=UPI00225697DB|nr:serine protease [Streptomyces sp. NBC_01443]MCX4632241.1 serine protease [Streptomyces sp. NBC_01443]